MLSYLNQYFDLNARYNKSALSKPKEFLTNGETRIVYTWSWKQLKYIPMFVSKNKKGNILIVDVIDTFKIKYIPKKKSIEDIIREGKPVKSSDLESVKLQILKLLSEERKDKKEKKKKKMPYVNQLLMYVGIFIGVLFSSAINQFQNNNDINLSFTLTTFIISAIISFMIVPIVYEKLKLNPDSPFIVQFSLFIQNGVFWHVVINSVGNAI